MWAAATDKDYIFTCMHSIDSLDEGQGREIHDDDVHI